MLSRLRSLWRGGVRRGAVEAEMAEEFRHHLELRTEDLVRGGMARDAAARRARLEFGHVDSHKEDARAARGLHVLDQVRFSWLDVKLGARMLARYPGLTLVGGLAMAFAIFVGAGTFHFINQLLDPTLPLPGGERIVGVRYWDRAANRLRLPTADDFLTWRAELRAIADLGAFQTTERNLAAGEEAGRPVKVARMTAAGFRVAGVRPLLGRTLVEADAEPGAAPVVVLGHRVWRTRLGSDPGIVGRTVRVGVARATVVGVMPEGFAFPQDHEMWEPLVMDGGRAGPSAPASVWVFGRLAPDATMAEAQAEASALVAGAAREAPSRYEGLSAQVLPYVRSLSGLRLGAALRLMIYQLDVYAALFLILVSANVALLMFARTATREREIVVRTALGASRGRIVSQLFVEALVLAVVATAAGLAATTPALRWIVGTLEEVGGAMPFWVDPVVGASTVLYAGALALLAAVVAGVVPALKATGRSMRARLGEVGAGAGGLRLGGLWTGIVVTQIAATVVFTGAAWVVARQASRSATVETFFPAEQYLGARIEMDRDGAAAGAGAGAASPADSAEAAFRRRYVAHLRDLERRVAEHPAVAAVTVAERLPMKAHEHALVEVEPAAGAGRAAPALPRHEVSSGAVDLRFFEVLGAPVLAGRAFDARDLAPQAGTVIVTASFVEEVLGGRSAVGRRIRYASAEPGAGPEPWREIVGVVRDLVADRTRSLDLEDPPRARVYHALDLARAPAYPLYLVARARGSAGDLAPAMHRLAETVSPALRVHDATTLDRANSDLARIWRLYADLVLGVSAIALFLSLAGIYAVTSFTVARRTREIGIRVALGARPARVVAEVFRRPFAHVGAGVAIGCVLIGALVWGLTGGRATARDGALLLAWGAGMLAVCGLACIGPTRRVLRVEPSRALSAES